METTGYQDAFNNKAQGENFSDLDDHIKGAPIGMRGLFGGGSEQVLDVSAAESSPSDGADVSSSEHPEWDPSDLQGHA